MICLKYLLWYRFDVTLTTKSFSRTTNQEARIGYLGRTIARLRLNEGYEQILEYLDTFCYLTSTLHYIIMHGH